MSDVLLLYTKTFWKNVKKSCNLNCQTDPSAAKATLFHNTVQEQRVVDF